MAKLKMYIRHRKYFVGDEIEYRVSNEIRHGIIVKTPYIYMLVIQMNLELTFI